MKPKAEKKKQQRPDQVVFNEEEERYDASLKPYASNLGAPAISTTDNLAWKNRNIHKVNQHIKTKYEELKQAYDAMMEKFEYNNLIYQAKFNFEPVVGHTYHLYSRKDKSTFLSIIAPNECNFTHIGSFYLNADGIWNRKNA